VLFTGAMELVANLAKAQADGRLEERLTHHAKPKLAANARSPLRLQGHLQAGRIPDD